MLLEFDATQHEPMTEGEAVLTAHTSRMQRNRELGRQRSLERRRPTMTAEITEAPAELLAPAKGGAKVRYPFDRLEIGQGFRVDVRVPSLQSMRCYCSFAGKQLGQYFRCMESTTEDGKRFLWVARVE